MSLAVFDLQILANIFSNLKFTECLRLHATGASCFRSHNLRNHVGEVENRNFPLITRPIVRTTQLNLSNRYNFFDKVARFFPNLRTFTVNSPMDSGDMKTMLQILPATIEDLTVRSTIQTTSELLRFENIRCLGVTSIYHHDVKFPDSLRELVIGDIDTSGRRTVMRISDYLEKYTSSSRELVDCSMLPPTVTQLKGFRFRRDAKSSDFPPNLKKLRVNGSVFIDRLPKSLTYLTAFGLFGYELEKQCPNLEVLKLNSGTIESISLPLSLKKITLSSISDNDIEKLKGVEVKINAFGNRSGIHEDAHKLRLVSVLGCIRGADDGDFSAYKYATSFHAVLYSNPQSFVFPPFVRDFSLTIEQMDIGLLALLPDCVEIISVYSNFTGTGCDFSGKTKLRELRLHLKHGNERKVLDIKLPSSLREYMNTVSKLTNSVHPLPNLVFLSAYFASDFEWYRFPISLRKDNVHVLNVGTSDENNLWDVKYSILDGYSK